MVAKRIHKPKRELLFCVTQAVPDGWLTTSLVLQIDFSHDRSEAHAKRVEVEMQAVRASDMPRGEVRESVPPVQGKGAGKGLLPLDDESAWAEDEGYEGYEDETSEDEEG